MRRSERSGLTASVVATSLTSATSATSAMSVMLVMVIGTVLGDEPTALPTISTSRDELVNQWDLNKDGRIDDSEAEIARSQMRRRRTELIQQSGIPAKGAGPLQGTVKGPGSIDPLGRAFAVPDAMPPKPEEPVPPPERKKDEKKNDAATKPSPRPLNAGSPRERTITTGGSRAGAPAVRPGYGASGPKVDLNAGRLPGGLPPSQGIQPQTGSMPFRRPASQPLQPPARLRPTGAGQSVFPPTTPRISAEDMGSP